MNNQGMPDHVPPSSHPEMFIPPPPGMFIPPPPLLMCPPPPFAPPVN